MDRQAVTLSLPTLRAPTHLRMRILTKAPRCLAGSCLRSTRCTVCPSSRPPAMRSSSISVSGFLNLLRQDANGFPVHSYVVPNLVSIDGQNVPPLFLREMLPWMIQSPLMPNIAIMMASATQSSEQDLMVKKSSETLSIQSHVFKIINQFLKQDFNEVGGEALRAVIHLAILEVS